MGTGYDGDRARTGTPYHDGPLGSSGAAPEPVAPASASAPASGDGTGAGSAGPVPPRAATPDPATPDPATPDPATPGAAKSRRGRPGAAESGPAKPLTAESGAATSGAATSGAATSGAGTPGAGTAAAGTPGAGASGPDQPREGRSRAGRSGTAPPGPIRSRSAAGDDAGDDAGDGDTGSGRPGAGTGAPPDRDRPPGRVRAWARGPVGRVAVPVTAGVLLLGAAVAAGAVLVPAALRDAPRPAAASAPAALPAAPAAGLPGPVPPSAAPQPGTASARPGAGGRPAEALADWATDVGVRVGIPVVAVQAYGYAELVQARTTPGCHLSWTTLAAIGRVESAHGSANGAVLGADGAVRPAVRGLPLDGNGGRQLIRDTDGGALDGDRQYDRAVGPMQFIPATWRQYGADADGDGTRDPDDLDDAALAAAGYLCAGGRDLAAPDAWWGAVLSYNAVRPYAQRVYEAADEYGRRSRAG